MMARTSHSYQTDGKLVVTKHGTIMQQIHPCNLQHTDTLKKNKYILLIEKPSNISQPTHIEICLIFKQIANNADQPNSNLSYKPEDVIPLPDELNMHFNTHALLSQTRNNELNNQNTPEFKQHSATQINHAVTISGSARNLKEKKQNWSIVSDSNDSRSMDWSDVDQWEVISTNT